MRVNLQLYIWCADYYKVVLSIVMPRILILTYIIWRFELLHIAYFYN